MLSTAQKAETLAANKTLPDLILQVDEAGLAHECLGEPANGLLATTAVKGVHIAQLLPATAAEAVCQTLEQSSGSGAAAAILYSIGEGEFERIYEARVNQFGSHGASIVIRDVTGAHKTELFLRQNKEKYANIFKYANDAIIIQNLHGEILDVNSKAISQFGYSRAEFAGIRFNDLFADDTNKDDIGSLTINGTIKYETLFNNKINKPFPAEVSASIFRIDDQQVVQNVIRDISDRKKAELSLQKRTYYLERLVFISTKLRVQQNADDIIQTLLEQSRLAVGADRAFLILADDATDSLNIKSSDPPKPELTGTEIDPQKSIASHVLQERQVHISHNPDENPQYYFQLGKLDQYIESVVFLPLYAQETPLGVIIIGFYAEHEFSEGELNLLKTMLAIAGSALQRARILETLEKRVTERTHALSVTNVKLARAVESKNQFLANVSHELRTPLNAILGQSELLQEGVFGDLSDKQERSLYMIHESGKHLLDMINDILDIAKIDAGKIDIHKQRISVKLVCESSIRVVKNFAYRKKINLSLDMDKNLETLYADDRRLKQILVNLLSNAIKFTPDGKKVGLIVRAEPQAKIARFIVWDEGIGIAETDLDKLFQPFMQLDASLARRFDGTGLGLSLVSKLTKLHGGKIEVESQLGSGSKFTVSIPQQEVDDDQTLPSPATKNKELPMSSTSEKADQKIKILLAEDNEDNIITMGEYLKFRGFDVIFARNGLEAVQATVERQPHLVLMDIQMPVMDGIQAIQEIRQDDQIAHIPIVALTALAMPGDKEKCLAAGANDYLSKPITLQICIVKSWI